MKIVIVGCGRVGASVAEAYDRAGHEVIIIDVRDRRLRPAAVARSAARAIRGDGTDEDVLRRAGAEGADVFLALTEGDNRNVMAAQLATEALGIDRRSSPRSTTRSGPRPTPSSASPRCAGPGLMLDAVNGYLGLPRVRPGRASSRRPGTIPAASTTTAGSPRPYRVRRRRRPPDQEA